MKIQSMLDSYQNSSSMSELKRKVTTLSGGVVRPLRLEEQASARIELKEPRPAGKTLQKRILPVNENRLSFDLKPPEGNSIKKPKLMSEELDPATEYNEFMIFDQGGAATIGSSNTRENYLVAIKKRSVPGGISRSAWKLPNHDNVVRILEVFCEGDEVCMIYEQMDVSLRHLTGTCDGQWDDYKIGAICKEVGRRRTITCQLAYLIQIVNGLIHIHKECSLYHGDLSCNTVLLSRDSYIKIGKPDLLSRGTRLTPAANIGDSIIERRSHTDEKAREDIRSLGSIMVELMEPTTYALDPQTIKLEHPSRWRANTGLKDFLASTDFSPLDVLAQVPQSIP